MAAGKSHAALETTAIVETPRLDLPQNEKINQDPEEVRRRLKVIQERRAMMKQSRTTTNRQDMFDLSRQRAALYNTTYQGIQTCPPYVPCL
jgi:hypothetical protein